ncbi:hypothetical protein ABTL76_19950, partial [Acinetobacter baumannii]
EVCFVDTKKIVWLKPLSLVIPSGGKVATAIISPLRLGKASTSIRVTVDGVSKQISIPPKEKERK